MVKNFTDKWDIKSMMAEEITEEMKATDQMKWVGLMNNCKAQAEEVVMRELIYS